jgi:cytochrome c-type biogenesis protein CcmH
MLPRRHDLILAALVAALALAAPARAVEPGEILPDPALEARARAISAELRCLVCQNQSIDDSNAPLAKDLRLLVRERLKAGEDNGQVMAYVVARYGDFVLLKPVVACAHRLPCRACLCHPALGWPLWRSSRPRCCWGYADPG